MKTKLWLLVPAGLSLAAFLVLGADADAAPSTEAPGPETRAERLTRVRVAQEAAYASRVAGYEAAAERAKQGILPEPEPARCPEGEIFWRRARDVDLCVRSCQTDSDCDASSRCRVIDSASDPAAPTRWAAISPVTPDRPGVAVCDPYWEVKGALSAHLAGIGPTTAEEEAAVMAEPHDDME